MIEASTIAALKKRHGTVHVLVGAGESVAVRAPTPAEWDTFRRLGVDPKKRHRAMPTLFRACCVHPRGRELDALLERKPAAAETFADRLLELAGVDPGVQARTY